MDAESWALIHKASIEDLFLKRIFFSISHLNCLTTPGRIIGKVVAPKSQAFSIVDMGN